MRADIDRLFQPSTLKGPQVSEDIEAPQSFQANDIQGERTIATCNFFFITDMNIQILNYSKNREKQPNVCDRK